MFLSFKLKRRDRQFVLTAQKKNVTLFEIILFVFQCHQKILKTGLPYFQATF